jgi:hypothetical protein
MFMSIFMDMTAIHEIQQTIFVDTPHGKGQALFLIDYGLHQNTIWVVTLKEDGRIKHYDSNQINVEVNHTIGLNQGKSVI